MNVVIDQGNTLIKCGVFEGDDLCELWTWGNEHEAIDGLIQMDKGNFIVSSVSGNPKEIKTILGQAGNKVLILDSTTKLPISNRYKSPATLGMDRVAAVCGAKTHFPDKHCLVIDFGTCITYDFIDRDNNYLGGAITPGLQMRFKAMNFYTESLPFVGELPSVIPTIGQTTHESMVAGVVLGILGEIEKFCAIYKEEYENLKVIFCGGDANRFETMTKDPTFAAPNLVLVGLNRILTYNNEE